MLEAMHRPIAAASSAVVKVRVLTNRSTAGLTGASVINCYSGGQKLFPAGRGWQPARHGPRDRVDAY